MNQWEEEKAEYQRRLAELANLYPELSPVELEEAEYNLRRYVEVLYRMVDRLSKEPDGGEKLRKLLGEDDNGKSPE